MRTPLNRVLLAFNTWEGRKKEMEPLVKGMDESVMRLLQLEHLRHTAHRLNASPRTDERPFLALLNNHIAKLEKQLYPNWFRRQFNRLKDRFYDGPNYLRQQAAQRAANMTALKLQLKGTGFHALAGKLEEHLDAESKSMAIPLASQINTEKQLNFTLYFERNSQEDFQFKGFHTSLRQNGEIQKAHHFELSDWPGLQTNQVWSLLEGRALQQHFTDASGQPSQRWVELGPNSARHYDPQHDFDVKKPIEAMPNLKGSKPEMIGYIKNGQCAPAIWKVGQNFQWIKIQADPANRHFKFFDDKDRPVSIEKLNQNVQRQGPGVKTLGEPIQRNRKGVKNGQHV